MRETRKKLLVVDDQYAIRLLLKEVFAHDDIEVLQAENGRQAIEMAVRHAPDLSLLDMKMPGMDGLEVLAHLRVAVPRMKVIIMTAYGELGIVKKTQQFGVLTHFTKPFDIEAIRCAVLRHLYPVLPLRTSR